MGNFDLRNYGITPLGPAGVTVPRAAIAAEVWQGGVMIADFTGAGALTFPGVITTLTGPQQRELAERVAMYIIACKVGLDG